MCFTLPLDAQQICQFLQANLHIRNTMAELGHHLEIDNLLQRIPQQVSKPRRHVRHGCVGKHFNDVSKVIQAVESYPYQRSSFASHQVAELEGKSGPLDAICSMLFKINSMPFQKCDRLFRMNIFVKIKLEVELPSGEDGSTVVGESDTELDEMGLIDVVLEMVVQ
ncbi:hypothetical protein LINGRAHAP2_LOCUS9751, partial [Linum grandiflorum]